MNTSQEVYEQICRIEEEKLERMKRYIDGIKTEAIHDKEKAKQDAIEALKRTGVIRYSQ